MFVGPLPPLARSLSIDAHATVPVAFTLLDAYGRVVPGATATLAVDGRPAVPGRADNGDAFRFHGNRYQYNLDLRAQGATGPALTLTIHLSDRTTHTLTLAVSGGSH